MTVRSSSMDLEYKLGLDFDLRNVTEHWPCGNFVRFKKLIGRGAFNDVYRGFDRRENAEVAWNQICFEDDKALNSPEIQERLFSEAILLKSLNHANIMKCHTSCKNQSVNMITEWFTSESLRHNIKKLDGHDLRTIKYMGRQILQGLHYLHTHAPCVVKFIG